MIRRAATVIAVAVALAAATAGPAQAHATLLRTDPADGASLRTGPRTMRMIFNEEVAPEVSRVLLVAPSGRSLPVHVLSKGDTDILRVRLPHLRRGVYRIEWRTVAADDLHTTTGEVVFGVGTAHVTPAAALPPDPLPPAGDTVARWIDFAAIATLVGALAVAILTLPPFAGHTAGAQLVPTLRALRLAAGGGALALATGVAVLGVQAAALPGGLLARMWTLASTTPYGLRWTLREALVAALVAITIGMRRRPVAAWPRAGAAVLGLALALVLAGMGHAGAERGELSAATAAMAVHLLAAAVWTGGLAAAVVAFVPLVRTDPALARAGLRRFGGLAAASVAAVVASGLYSLGVQVASLDALLYSTYGRTLLLKSVLFASVAALGLVNFTLVRRASGAALRRTVVVEALLAAAVLVPAAALTTAAPAHGPRWDRAAARPVAPATVYSSASDLIVRTSVKPNRPGPNYVSVAVVQTRKPVPGPVTGVDVTWDLPGAAAVTDRAQADAGTWRVPLRRLPATGALPLTVVVHRGGVEDTRAHLRWRLSVPDPAPHERTRVSNRPLAPVMTPLAIAAAAGGVLAGVLLAARRRPPATWTGAAEPQLSE